MTIYLICITYSLILCIHHKILTSNHLLPVFWECKAPQIASFQKKANFPFHQRCLLIGFSMASSRASTFSTMAFQCSYISHNECMKIPISPYPCQHFYCMYFFFFLTRSILVGVEWLYIAFLIHISLMQC